MPIDPQSRYVQLGEMIATMPDLTARPMLDAVLQWCARVRAILNDSHDLAGIVAWDSSLHSLHSTTTPTDARYSAADRMRLALFNALAEAELHAPATVRGAFIPAGNAHEALTAVAKVVGPAKRDVLIVDPYMDHKTLSDYAILAADKVAIRLLSDSKTVQPSPAAKAWIKQHTTRPLTVRLTQPRALHDRLMIVDGQAVFVLTQSLNNFAGRSPATIQRVDAETANLKLDAFEDIWNGAAPFDVPK